MTPWQELLAALKYQYGCSIDVRMFDDYDPMSRSRRYDIVTLRDEGEGTDRWYKTVVVVTGQTTVYAGMIDAMVYALDIALDPGISEENG
jgi:hypothetical protein